MCFQPRLLMGTEFESFADTLGFQVYQIGQFAIFPLEIVIIITVEQANLLLENQNAEAN